MARGRVSLREAVVLISVSYGTGLKLRESGALRTIRVGSMWMVSLDEIERFNKFGNYVPPTPEQLATEKEEKAEEARKREDERRGPSNVPSYLQHLVKGSSHE